MPVSLAGFSWWLWSRGGGRGTHRKEKKDVDASNGSSSSAKSNLASTRKAKKKWHSREARRSDKQFCGRDVVSVASDGGGVCLSGSESDGPDWSIGWVEAHGPGFVSTRNDHGGVGGGDDDGFAVLVPCYKPGCKKLVECSTNQILGAIKNLSNRITSEGKSYTGRAEGKSYMEWLSSQQNF